MTMKTYQILINVFRIPTWAMNRQKGIRVHTSFFFFFGKIFPCSSRVRVCTLIGSSLCPFSFAALLWRLHVFVSPFAWPQQEYIFSLHCTIIEPWVASHQLSSWWHVMFDLARFSLSSQHPASRSQKTSFHLACLCDRQPRQPSEIGLSIGQQGYFSCLGQFHPCNLFEKRFEFLQIVRCLVRLSVKRKSRWFLVNFGWCSSVDTC